MAKIEGNILSKKTFIVAAVCLTTAWIIYHFTSSAPRPYANFTGKIAKTISESSPEQTKLPKLAAHLPNIIIIQVENLGFSAISAYGSEIKTPNIDKLAASGVKFTNFETAPSDYESRAALLTGSNPHAVGMGSATNKGYPGYVGEIARHAPTIAEILSAQGYTTMMIGKWPHSIKSGIQQWPLQRGFQHFVGVLANEKWHMRGNEHVDKISNWTDEAIHLLQENKITSSDQAFFLYLALPAFSPSDVHATQNSLYQHGWNAIREQRYQRQLQLGIIPANTVLPKINMDIQEWESLTHQDQLQASQYMADYAAYLTDLDKDVGKLYEYLANTNQLANTIIIFSSSGGAPALKYPGWAAISNTPYQSYQGTTLAGASRVPFIFSWPDHLKDTTAIRQQYVNQIDVLPTLLNLIGITFPKEHQGIRTKPMNGVSFKEILFAATATSQHFEQYAEINGHRSYYKKGWKLIAYHQPGTPFSDQEWKLYFLHDDPTEIHDLSLQESEKCNELILAFDKAAWDNQVYPLDDRIS